MTAVVDTPRPENADPAVWAHPEEWEPGTPLYERGRGGWTEMLDMVQDVGPGVLPGHDPDEHDWRCDTCVDSGVSHFRWWPEKPLAYGWDGPPLDPPLTPFYGAHPALRSRETRPAT